MTITVIDRSDPVQVINEDGEFECPHDNWQWEQVEVDTMRNGEHDTYTVPVAVCNDCGIDLDYEPETNDCE